MILRFPKPDNRDVLQTAHALRHTIQISEWQHTNSKQTVDYSKTNGASVHNLKVNLVLPLFRN